MTNSNEENFEGKLPHQQNFTSNNDNNKIVRNYEYFPSKNKKDSYESKTCTYFSKFGYCKFGSNCNYIHEKGTFQHSRVYKYSYKTSYKNENVEISESPFPLQNEHKQRLSRQICRYFKAGFCGNGNRCYFRHSFSAHKDEKYSTSFSVLDSYSKKASAASNNKPKKISIPLCHYFKRGLCHKGDQCKYYHQSKNISNHSPISISVDSTSNQNDNLSNNTQICDNNQKTDNSMITLKKMQNANDLSLLTTEDISKLRATEISQMKKRFPHLEIIVENQSCFIVIQPSDPDWPFDLRNLKAEIYFPDDYPTEKCNITVVQGDEPIPELLVKYLNKSISDWIDTRHESNIKNNKAELIFRPFLKWFDRNLEELFISGLRKVKQDLKAREDGIEFVPAENLFSTSKENDADENFSSKDNTELNTEPQTHNTVPKNSSTVHKPNTNSFGNSNGFKIIFSELELTDGAAALICTKISVTLHCSRCKTPFNMKSVPKKSNSHVCSKCSKDVGFVFEPSTVHQFSNVLGNLYLLDCLAADINLVECHFLVDCLNCSKQVPVDGIHYGQKHKMWCTFCHDKMIMSIGSVKFQTLKLESIPTVKYIPAKKIDKKVKDPVIKEGEALPNFGACKHYKKSFRWLRFPCCGRLYPCDECHNEKEIEHEMKYASRMVCGFCAKEQPYSREKPCIMCSQSLTKKASTHWEGGKGCRNKIQMGREDKQKYSGVSKTVSRKAQSLKQNKK